MDEAVNAEEKVSIFILDGITPITVGEEMSSPVRYAVGMLIRDFENVFRVAPVVTHGQPAGGVVIRKAVPGDECPARAEAFVIRFIERAGHQEMHIAGYDELGIVYGILHVSRTVLGVDPFWFWAETLPEQRTSIPVPAVDYVSPAPRIRFRGWFVNDEVCLIGWKEVYPPGEEVWLPVFEALLRCGGNMVIPGTDLPKSGIHADLASAMGLWVTHHHAEPLGAEMFLRAFPGRTASYAMHPDLFEELWQEAIEKQKDRKTLWVLSFRGQGDAPFWEYDPAFDTPEKRGGLISRVIRKQYDMVRSAVREPQYCVALYGEIAELYKEGHISLPDDVIKVWADNGYGKMVSRRQGNTNLRVPSLPLPGEAGKHGLYYHVTFHDLQASNHLTMFPSPAELIRSELESAIAAGVTDYWLVNCGNILPHLYTLDLVRELWQDGKAKVDRHLREFVSRHFRARHEELAALYRAFAAATIQYGPNADDKAGDEFYHHPARRIIGHWLQGRGDTSSEDLWWATGEIPFPEQVAWFMEITTSAAPVWQEMNLQYTAVAGMLDPEDQGRLYRQLGVQISLHESGCRGLLGLCQAYEAYRRGDAPAAFVLASRSKWAYEEGQQALRQAEEGRWQHFFRADWLTNVQCTADNLETLRRYLRMQGDSPNFFQWYKEYLMPETEKHIYLENTHRNPLSDDELARRLGELFDGK
jgi:hypothetical protein